MAQQHMQDEFPRFRRWLFSLDRDELLNAMRFSFAGGVESHEYDLLVEMVQLQSPPPTPVHPGALNYKPWSQFGPQLDYGAERLRSTQPRLFQWSERLNYGSSRARKGKPQPRFDVIARKKVAPWGEVFSLGCTSDQREADESILDGTFLQHNNGTQQQITASFHAQRGLTARKIIKMVQVASRGNFLQPQTKSSIPFCAPWLKPTERWFSLSFYLASRYQISLWESFSGRATSNRNHLMEYEPKILSIAIPSAIQIGLKRAMEKDKQEKLNFLRDSLLWGILCAGYNEVSGCSLEFLEIGIDWGSAWKSLSQTRLLHITKPSSQLRHFFNRALEHTVAAEMEKAILQEPIQSQPKLPTTRKKKKKKKAKKYRSEQTKNADKIDQSKKNDDSMNDEESTNNGIDEAPSFDFPDNRMAPFERNRNIIMALTILEDVIEAAFVEAGLEPTLPFECDNNKCPKHDNKSKGVRVRSEGVKVANSNSNTNTAFSNGKSIVLNDREPRINLDSQTAQSRIRALKKSTEKSQNAEIPRTLQWPPGKSLENGPRSVGLIPDFSSSQNGFPSGFHQHIVSDDFTYGKPIDDDVLDGWPFTNRYQSRERSILTDFFRLQEERFDEDEKLMAASTAASISSSTYKDPTVVADADEIEKNAQEDSVLVSVVNITEDENDLSRTSLPRVDDEDSQPSSDRSSADFVEITDSLSKGSNVDTDQGRQENPLNEVGASSEDLSTASSQFPPDCRSPSPEAPITPPPTLSPILVSLADLRDMKRISLIPERLSQSNFPISLPNSPVPPHKNGLTPSWSREDLRIASFRDDHNIQPKKPHLQPQRSSEPPQQQSYRAAAVKSLAKPIASSKAASLDFRSRVFESSLKREHHRESCAQSETALEGHREDHHWHDNRNKPPHDEIENKSVTRDGSTTITSALSQREPEEIASIREERNSFRDMCLTLGAEVAKLKAMLSTQKASASFGPIDFQDSFNHPVYRPGSFDPNCMPPFFHGMQRGQRLGPMSDAGLHRAGDHESQFSEDELFDPLPKARNESVRRMSSNATVVESDASIHSTVIQSGSMGVMPVYDSVPVHGLQSRLAKDILQFLDATRMQLKKLDNKRSMAVERFSRLVNTLWPRAQVKVYGSHVSGLCLPSSDLDFVVCLPAVHNYAPALAPGVLEGRNSINETSQKVLARELKGESWIDPRSIKLIERTVVPVIKVSTKDTRARMIQLDVSFDSPDHHGLEANEMVSKILEELPLIRPLVLVLKQFLLDRGLLTAYTGGLSSYCLFLMVARYLQEQSPSCGDCGSLLMGFLDFYGNHFNPRATGISVRRRQYFARPNDAVVAGYEATGQPMWTPPPLQQHVGSNSPSSAGSRDFLRRNSFSDTGSVDCVRRNPPSSLPRPHRFQPSAASAHRFVPHSVPHPNQTNITSGYGRPFTFDPLFVEDPLSSTNNIGRNAFRIFQVQRAFSDAHRALVASLEWDIHSSGELNDDVDYPLLKCLLQSEDVLYDL